MKSLVAHLKSRELQYFSQIFMLCMIIHTMFRALFFAVYSDEFAGVPAPEILRGFIYGLRFDLAVTATLLGVVFLLMILPWLNRHRWYRAAWAGLAWLVVALFLVLSFSDLQYFEHSKKRLGYEAFVYLDSSLIAIARTAVLDKPLYLIALVGTGACFYFFMRWHMRRTMVLEPGSMRPMAAIMLFLVVAPLLVLMARGGVQRVPLRVSDSFISRFSAVNTLALNSPYSVIRSLGKTKAVKLMSDARAREITLELLGVEKTSQLAPGYPLLRSIPPHVSAGGDSGGKYNVVIFLLESWTGKFMGPGGDTTGVTPVFNALAGEGLYFNRFVSSGARTTSGLFSTLTGMPDQPVLPVMMRPELQDNFASLSVLLKGQGYENIFVHGGLLDFDNLQNMLVHEMFDVIVGKQHMAGSGGVERVWGYDDEHTFIRANEEFRKQAGSPFFGYVLSGTSHSPFELPEDAPGFMKPGDHPQYEYLNALHYSDWSLGEFFRRAREEDYFNNTIFIITGDHSHHDRVTLFENQNVPLMIYAPGLPGIITPGVRPVIGSHMDILPTVAAMLGLPYHASMGRNLLALNDDEGFAFWAAGPAVGWLEGDHMSIMSMDGKVILVYDYASKDFSTDIGQKNPALSAAYKEKLSAYYQTSASLLGNNAILPVSYLPKKTSKE